MANVTLPYTATAHAANSSAGVMSNWNAIIAQVNGNLDVSNMATSLLNNFLKLATVEDLKLKYGDGVGGSFDSATPYSKYEENVTHGLGRTPKIVLLMPTNAPAVQVQAGGSATALAPPWAVTSRDATVFHAYFSAPGQSNNAVTFKWLAIG